MRWKADAKRTVHVACTKGEENLREAIHAATKILEELRATSLTPQRYYDLYLRVCDELTHLEVRNETHVEEIDAEASDGCEGKRSRMTPTALTADDAFVDGPPDGSTGVPHGSTTTEPHPPRSV